MRHQYSCQVCFGFGSVRLCSRTGSTAASSRRHRDNTALALLWVPPVAVVGGHVSAALAVRVTACDSRCAIGERGGARRTRSTMSCRGRTRAAPRHVSAAGQPAQNCSWPSRCPGLSVGGRVWSGLLACHSCGSVVTLVSSSRSGVMIGHSCYEPCSGRACHCGLEHLCERQVA